MADILVIDDQDRTVELCRRGLPGHRFRGPARDWAAAFSELEHAQGRIDLILLDVHFELPPERLLGVAADASAAEVDAARRYQGLAILAQLRRRWPELPVILMTARDDLALDGELATGADEQTWLLDDDQVDARSLAAQIDGIVRARRGGDADGPVFWGSSLSMRRVRQRLAVLAQGRLPVVLLGPTGTGKSLLARHVVHPTSGRTGSFVAVDLSTIPRDLMAATLFGSVRGAYTGAVADRVGAFEAANGGTLFLDEIGNLGPDAQKLLLSVLQEGVVSRIGDVKERQVDVKVVVATCEDLRELVASGRFRADLLMRLNPATAVTLPSLTERALDLEALLAHCIEQAVSRRWLRGLLDSYRRAQELPLGPVQVVTGAVPEPHRGTLFFLFPERALRLLRAHPWPGNLREFAMVVENAVHLALAELIELPPGERSDVVQVRPRLVRDLLGSLALDAERTSPPRVDTVAGQSRSPEGIMITLSPQETLNKVAVACERQYFLALFEQTDGDFAKMAQRLLGDATHARKVQLRLNQLGLRVRDLREQTD